MDIVYLVKEDQENHSEDLRYSLRSLSNVPHEKVFIVGEKPSWAKNVTHISVAQNKTKNENWRMNLTAAVSSDLISDNFVMMNDDFFIMKKISVIPNLNFGPMAEVIEMYKERYPEGSKYINSMCNLYDLLTQKSYEDLVSYELHVPVVINKQRVVDLYRLIGGEPVYQFRSYYGNYYKVGGTTSRDVKIFMDSRHNDPEYNDNPYQYMKAQTFLSTTGGSFKRGLAGKFIRDSFSSKSIYEA